LLEPLPRGTASVVGLAAVALQARDPQAVMAILTSDHYIGNEDRFRQLLAIAERVAENDFLVTLGIEPTFAASGYGYIQKGGRLDTYNGMDVYQVERFTEKPDEQTARRFLESGDHSWNSGMFVWQVSSILAEFERQMPALFASLQEIFAAWGSTSQKEVIQRVWPQLKSETIDYGIMEGARRVAVIPASGLEWSDVGSWDSLFDLLEGDEEGNIVMGGNHIGLDTHDTLVYVDEEPRLIVTIGVQELVVVDTGDVLLVCHKDQAQRVRQVVNHLKENDRNYI
jgi:mannose-1-phosphate guanylyltransferase